MNWIETQELLGVSFSLFLQELLGGVKLNLVRELRPRSFTKVLKGA